MKKRVLSLFMSLVMVVSLAVVMPTMTVGAENSDNFEYEILDSIDFGIVGYNGLESEHIHSYIEKKIQIPTCTDKGVKNYTCDECGDSYIETITETEHSYITKIVAPTYAEQGYTLYICSICGESYKDNYTEKLTLSKVSNFTVSSTTASSIKLTYNKVSGADGYIIYKYDNAKRTWVRIAKTTTNSNTYTVSKLSAGTTYKFAVKAYKSENGKEVVSASYPQLTTTTNPANITKVNFTSSANAVKMSWSKVSGATGYRVYQYNTSTKKWKAVANTKNTNYTFKSLKAGTTYKFTVRAYKTQGGKTYLSPKYTTFTSSTNPEIVNFNLTSGVGKATVKWSKVIGATGYKVYYKTSKNGSWKLLKTTNNKTTSYIKTGLTKGKTYYFTVKAYRTASGKTYNGAYTAKSVNIKKKLILPTKSISQISGQIAGYAACGPTAVAMLLNSEKNTNWNKDNLIRYSETNYLNDQGSLRSGGGMTSPKLLQLIKGYSNGKYTARNIYSSTVSPSTIIMQQLESGHRCIVVVQYTSTIVTHYNSGTHFVVVCGYEYIGGILYFYYADPYYFGSGNRPLRTVSDNVQNSSMNMVVREPRTCIVLN